MEEKRTKLNYIMDNLYIRAERAGTVKFQKEEDRQAAKDELVDMYKEYFALLSSRGAAHEKSIKHNRVGTSREEKKFAKMERKEGKKELKEINKQLEALKQQIDSKMDIFDLPEIKGKQNAYMMIQNAYQTDLKDSVIEERRQRLAKICPHVQTDAGKAIEATQNANKVEVKQQVEIAE